MSSAVDDPVDLSLRHFVSAWRTMCSGAAGYTDAADGGVHYVFSGVPIAFFNVAIVTARGVTAAALESAGRQACDLASGHGVPWMFVTTREAFESGVDAEAALDGCGLVPLMPLTGMIAQHAAPSSNVPPELQLVRPDDDASCSAILDVNSRAYAMDLAACKSILGTQSFWAEQFPALGLVDGTPVCAAGVMMLDGYRYVALVATDPDRQRRGYGDAVMRHALDLAGRAHGNGPTTLHATEAGRPIYERMGYAPLAAHTIFMERKFLAGH